MNAIVSEIDFDHLSLEKAHRVHEQLLELQAEKISHLVRDIDRQHIGIGTSLEAVKPLVGGDLVIETGYHGARYGMITFIPPIRLPAKEGQTTLLRQGWHAFFNLNSNDALQSNIVLAPNIEVSSWFVYPRARDPDPFGSPRVPTDQTSAKTR
ncbi:MAG: hypothetical protein JNM99_17235 [Verrucomicrobiaceae bacterium]|nr:hypothetical protein [Verrucomicrobiaceae bacterium]